MDDYAAHISQIRKNRMTRTSKLKIALMLPLTPKNVTWNKFQVTSIITDYSERGGREIEGGAALNCSV